MSRGDKREQILEAAGRVFASRQFHEVTLDEVAKAAHVSKGAIYLYFKDKEDLFFQVAAHGFDELCRAIRENVPAEDTFERRLRAACRQIHRFFEARRPIRRSLMEHAGRATEFRGSMKAVWCEQRRKVDAALGAILRDGMEEGVIRDQIEPERLARLLLGFLGGRAHLFEGETERAPSVEAVVDIFLGGIRTGARELAMAGEGDHDG